MGFVLCTIPKLYYKILVIATSFVGATAFMLGVDCFTTVGLKEVRFRRDFQGCVPDSVA